MDKEEIINKLTTLSKAKVIADFSEKEYPNTNIIEVDNDIFKETIKLINNLENDLKLEDEILIKLAIGGKIKYE